MREDVRGRGESGIGRGGFQIARVFPGCCLEVTEGARGSGGGADWKRTPPMLTGMPDVKIWRLRCLLVG
jgi:hypothetical protein